MKILVIGGMHGNEPLGIKIVKGLKLTKPDCVDYIIANPRAVKLKQRFVESDLNRSFGSLFPGTYESARAEDILKLIENYDLVLDFHNTQSPRNDSLFIGENFSAFNQLNLIPIDNCIIATYDCLNKFSNNVISIEISLDSKLNDAEYWLKFLDNLSEEKACIKAEPKRFYRFSIRVAWKEFDQFKFKWKPFQKIKPSDIDNLNLEKDREYVPIFIGSNFTEFYATIIEII